MFNLLGKIKDFFIYDIPQGIQNLFIWFPIIWKDRNWDQWYIYTMLRHKLHLTEQLIRYHGHHIRNIQDADHIKTCILLLDRIMNDEYHENAFKPYYNKWGEPKMIWTDLKDEPGYTELNFEYPNVKTDEEDKIRQKEYKRYSKLEQNLRQQDITMLFSLMKKHIQGWWD